MHYMTALKRIVGREFYYSRVSIISSLLVTVVRVGRVRSCEPADTGLVLAVGITALTGRRGPGAEIRWSFAVI